MLAWSRHPALPFREAYALQRALRERVQAGVVEVGHVLLVDHPPTVTYGLRHPGAGLLCPEEVLRAQGVELVGCDRGGLATYHGPGQLVAYPIVRLAAVGASGVRAYVALLEEAMIRLCTDYGVHAQRDPSAPGVWVGREKIGAIGLHVDQGVAHHGLAFNVAPNLRHFGLIVPCGLADRGVTSLAALGVNAPLEEAAARLALRLGEAFGHDMRQDNAPAAAALHGERP